MLRVSIRENLPEFVSQIKELSDLIYAEQAEIDRVSLACDAMLDEMFIKTFTQKTAQNWERLYGLEPAPDFDIGYRRHRVVAKMLMQSPLTPVVLKNIIEELSESKVELFEDYENMRIVIKFVGEFGVTPYMISAQNEIEKIRPFHLPIIYEYSYVTIGNYDNNTLEQLGDSTFEELSLAKI